MAGPRGDALGNLFNDIKLGNDIDGKFGKPKTLSDMKSKNSMTPISSMGCTPQPTKPEPPKPPQNETIKPPDVSGDDLEAMFSNLSTQAQPSYSTAIPATTATTADDPWLDLGVSVSNTAQTAAVASNTAATQDIFGVDSLHNSIAPPIDTSNIVQNDDDDMFGVFNLPPVTEKQQSVTTSHHPSAASLASEDSLDLNFGTKPSTAAPSRAGDDDGGNITGMSTPERRQQQQQLNNNSVQRGHSSNGSLHQNQGREDASINYDDRFTSPDAANQRGGDTNNHHSRSSSFAERITASEPPPRRHRAFDYLEPVDDEPQMQQRPASAASQQAGASAHNRVDSSKTTTDPSGLLSRPPPQPQHGFAPHMEKTTEVVADLSHKAAKMLQVGGKWLSKTTKTLAAEVHTRIEKHRQATGGDYNDDYYNNTSATTTSGGNNNAHRPPPERTGPPPSHLTGGATPGYFYDWAAQLNRISPGSRAAALSAMSEDDRLTVQRILDEAALGEDSLPESGSASNKRKESSQQPPPPSYEEVVAPQSSQKTAAAVERPKASNTSIKKKQPEQQPAADFLGMSDEPTDKQTAAGSGGDIDLMGLNEDSSQAATTADVDIDAMFSVNDGTSSSSKARSRASQQRQQQSRATAASSGHGADSMIDLGAELAPDVDTSGFDALYADAEDEEGRGDPNEPEIRRQLRQKRIQEKHDRMMKMLAEKRAKDEEDEAERQGKVELRDILKPRVDAWMAGKKDNIRALLSNLHTVLWPDSGWTQPNMSDMVDNNKVKRAYMKANLIVHPDKVKQKGGSLEQIAIADMVFDVLKGAWGKFEASNK